MLAESSGGAAVYEKVAAPAYATDGTLDSDARAPVDKEETDADAAQGTVVFSAERGRDEHVAAVTKRVHT